MLESPLDCKEIQPVNPKGNQSWIFIARSDVEDEASILWPPDAKNWLTENRPWYWERLRAGGEGDARGWDDWMASLTQWIWAWVSSRSWWWTGRPGVLQAMGSQSWTRLSDWTGLNYINAVYCHQPNGMAILCPQFTSVFTHIIFMNYRSVSLSEGLILRCIHTTRCPTDNDVGEKYFHPFLSDLMWKKSII